MAYEIPRIISVSGRTIQIAHLDLPNQPLTYLLTAAAALDTALVFTDNVGFSNTNLLLIGELGREQTEIRSVNGAVTAGTSITSTALVFSHPAGTPVRRILFNQYKIYGTNTNSFATNDLVATVDMQVNAPHTTYVNSGTEYAYYWAVPYDSINAVTGDNSDSVAKTTGYNPNTVGALIKSALDSTKKEKGGKITEEWFMEEINNCLRYVSGKLKHWSTLENFDYILGQTVRGTFSYALPSDIEDANSNKSILSVRIGSGDSLTYMDKKEYETRQDDVVKNQVRVQAAISDVTLKVDNSYDFADSGSVDVFVSGTKYTITYTGVTRSATAGVLTGIPAAGTGSITVIIPVDTYVWQNEVESQPLYYTVYDGNLYIDSMPSSDYDNMNVYIDYFTSRTLVNSPGDAVESPRYDMVKHWLCWKLHGLENASGKLDLKDGDWILFNTILVDALRRETTSQKFKMKFRVNGITY